MKNRVILVSGLFWNDGRKHEVTVERELEYWKSKWCYELDKLGDNPMILFLEKRNFELENFVKYGRPIKIVYLDPFEKYKNLYKSIWNICQKNPEKGFMTNRTVSVEQIFIWWLKSHLVMGAYEIIEGSDENYKDSTMMWVDFGIKGNINDDISFLEHESEDSKITICNYNPSRRNKLPEMNTTNILNEFINREEAGSMVGSTIMSNKVGWNWFNKEISKWHEHLIRHGQLIDDDMIYDLIYSQIPDAFNILDQPYNKPALNVITEYTGKLK